MREQVATHVFSLPTERKPTSIKLSQRHEINDDNKRRRLGAACISHYGGKPVMHMPGERFRGGSSSLSSKEQDVDHNARRASTEKMNEDAKDEIEKERTERKVSDGRVVLPQWGQRKRPRCSRVDLKHAADEACLQSRKAAREGRQAVKEEKGVGEEDAMEKVEEKRREHGVRLDQSSNDRANSDNDRIISNNDGATGKIDRSNSNSCSPAELPQANGHRSPHRDEHRASPPFSSSSLTLAVFKVDVGLLQWPRILLSLSRKEKEDDFFSIKGSKLPQRPKRRPKAVEKALNYCSPGIWLGDLSRGRYDVREKKRGKKKPRGLKAMESMDSDSD